MSSDEKESSSRIPSSAISEISAVPSRLRAWVVFSPDGSKLASICEADGLVRVWALDLDDLITIATDRLTRTLDDDECRQYLHLERCPDA